MNKKIIFIAFGTSDISLYKKCIFPFLDDAKKMYGEEYEIELCFTSNKVMNEIKENKVDILVKYISEIKKEGYKEIIIYPLYLIEGIEFLKIREWANTFKCESLILKEPLLKIENNSLKRKNSIIELINSYNLEGHGTMVIAHGSKNGYNLSYDLLRREIEKESSLMYLITLNDQGLLDSYLENYRKNGIKKIIIIPFFIALGYHFQEDININIVKCIEEKGFEVIVIQESLGSNSASRKLFLNEV